MYVTTPLSKSRRSLKGYLDAPNDGPFSGYLVITDKEAQEENTCCWGSYEIDSVTKFPFPQDRSLKVNIAYEESGITKLWFIPVLDLPPSYNTYYVICVEGKHRGLSCVCSREADKVMGLFGRSVKELKPRPFDHRDVYQKFKILRGSNKLFHGESIASDGFPPKYLRTKSWEVCTSKAYQPNLEQASGLNTSLRARLPDFTFPISFKCSDPVIVGKWYCPFVFFREDGERHDQMKRSMFYKMVLKQRWEKIYTCESVSTETNHVAVNINMQKEDISLFGMKAERDDMSGHDGLVWFRVVQTMERTGRGMRWGMSTAVFEKMKWVQKEGGYVVDNVDDGAKKANVEVAVEVERGTGGRKGFCCYVLVESFVLTRLDGSAVMTYEFRHTDKVRIKWE